MGNTPTEFANRMRQRAKELPERVNEAVKESVEQMFIDMVHVMPVDTSQAISNTRIGVGSKPIGELQPYSTGSRGSTRGASSSKTISEGLADLATKKPGQTVYLSNTAKHIGDLDVGSSAQFAGGFIARAKVIFSLALQEASRNVWR